MKTGLLALAEYSNKYKVSVSTLRRRIKAGEIKYEFDSGKYWLEDRPLKKERTGPALRTSENHKPAPVEESSTKSLPSTAQNGPLGDDVLKPEITKNVHESSQSILNSANELIQELKGAYVLILQEKEEQILSLREEVADLKTLVKILESENEKLKQKDVESASDEIEWSLEDPLLQDSFSDES